MRVDQVIPHLASRDAIGVHTLNLSAALRAAGIDSDIFYGECSEDVASRAKPVTDLGRAERGRHLLYQSSIGSPVFDVFMARSEPKLVNYHNITPVELIEPWEPAVGFELRLGRAQLDRLARHSQLAVSDSAYNEKELIELGYTPTAVVPLLIDMTTAGAPADPALMAKLARARESGGADFLYVGKIAPHKAPHDLVKMLSVFHTLYDPRARLHLVGSEMGTRYGPALAALVADLGLDDTVFVTGSLPPAALEAYFQAADVFLTASDHEGFCVPVVEAMGHGLPVVAYGAGAVPETVGEAGLVLPDKTPALFAAAVARVMGDAALRERMARAARQRVQEFGLARSSARFAELVAGAVGA